MISKMYQRFLDLLVRLGHFLYYGLGLNYITEIGYISKKRKIDFQFFVSNLRREILFLRVENQNSCIVYYSDLASKMYVDKKQHRRLIYAYEKKISKSKDAIQNQRDQIIFAQLNLLAVQSLMSGESTKAYIGGNKYGKKKHVKTFDFLKDIQHGKNIDLLTQTLLPAVPEILNQGQIDSNFDAKIEMLSKVSFYKTPQKVQTGELVVSYFASTRDQFVKSYPLELMGNSFAVDQFAFTLSPEFESNRVWRGTLRLIFTCSTLSFDSVENKSISEIIEISSKHYSGVHIQPVIASEGGVKTHSVYIILMVNNTCVTTFCETITL